MSLAFPSTEFFAALQEKMREQGDRFRQLGYFDTKFGVRVTGEPARAFVLEFDVFECVGIREVAEIDPGAVDFVLEGSLEAWREMLENIRANGKADGDHSINTLTHFGEKIRVVYDDPDGHDKLYRFDESIQQYFDLAASLDVSYPAGTSATGKTARKSA